MKNMSTRVQGSVSSILVVVLAYAKIALVQSMFTYCLRLQSMCLFLLFILLTSQALYMWMRDGSKYAIALKVRRFESRTF